MQAHAQSGQSSDKCNSNRQARLQGHSEQMAAVASTIAISLAAKSSDVELETLINLFGLITHTLRVILDQRAVDRKTDLTETVIL